MEKLNKILVPVDGSKQSIKALDRALMLGGFTHAEVTALHVVPHMGNGPRTKIIDKEIVHDGRKLLEKLERRATNKDIRFKTNLIRGSPAMDTLKFAKNGKFDHIVMSTTGSGNADKDMFGSVSNYVLHKSKIPVYLIK